MDSERERGNGKGEVERGGGGREGERGLLLMYRSDQDIQLSQPALSGKYACHQRQS